MIRTTIFLASLVAAALFASSAQATTYHTTHYAMVKYNDSPCGSACQLVFATGSITKVVAVGSAQLRAGFWTNAWVNYDFAPGYHTVSMWARRACSGGGYKFSGTKTSTIAVGALYPTDYWWGNFLIYSTSGCRTAMTA